MKGGENNLMKNGKDFFRGLRIYGNFKGSLPHFFVG